VDANSSEALAVIVAARNEADRIGETVAALRGALPGSAIWVADDASGDGTAEVAMAAGARVVSRGRSHGKGGNVTATAEAVLSDEGPPQLVLLCDADLRGDLRPLLEGGADVVVARFARRSGAATTSTSSPYCRAVIAQFSEKKPAWHSSTLSPGEKRFAMLASHAPWPEAA